MNIVEKVARPICFLVASAVFTGVAAQAAAGDFALAWSVAQSSAREPGLVIDRKAYPSFSACEQEAERRAKLKSAYHTSYYCIPQDIRSQAQEVMPYPPVAHD